MTNKMLKYGFAMIAVVALCCVACAGAASATIYINSVEDWNSQLTGKDVTDDIVLGANLDLDFGGENCMIASLSKSFEGNGSTIRNFSICESVEFIGLIGVFSGKSIKNITVCDFSHSTTHTQPSLGALAGKLSPSGSIVTIDNVCVKNGNVYAGAGKIGGLVGYPQGMISIENCNILNCCFDGGAVGGLLGYVGALLYISVNNSDVENCVITGSYGNIGGCIGVFTPQASSEFRIDNCRVRNTLIYSLTSAGDCGGIIGKFFASSGSSGSVSVSNCTVEFCTVAANSGNAGGITSNFPTTGVLDRNKVISSCIVSKSGKAAGICPAVLT